MRRREFLTILGGAAALIPLTAVAQPLPVRRLGVLFVLREDNASVPSWLGALNRINQDVDMVTLRINYRFGGYGAPVAARY